MRVRREVECLRSAPAESSVKNILRRMRERHVGASFSRSNTFASQDHCFWKALDALSASTASDGDLSSSSDESILSSDCSDSESSASSDDSPQATPAHGTLSSSSEESMLSSDGSDSESSTHSTTSDGELRSSSIGSTLSDSESLASSDDSPLHNLLFGQQPLCVAAPFQEGGSGPICKPGEIAEDPRARSATPTELILPYSFEEMLVESSGDSAISDAPPRAKQACSFGKPPLMPRSSSPSVPRRHSV